MATVSSTAKPQTTLGKFQNIDIRAARVLAAPLAEGMNNPARVLNLDLGPLGHRVSVGQYALVAEEELVGRNVIAVVNFAPREMGQYTSQALTLGAPHPDSPDDQAQATPLFVSNDVPPGAPIF